MPRYTDDSRERVREAVDMVDLVQTRTELKRSGANQYSGRCCFHEERTPSLSVDSDRKLYHCFGCQAGGDCFKFVQETEGLDFPGALEFLAGRYGVTLTIVDDDPASAARRKREMQLLALVERAAAFYERLLWTAPEGEAARDYLLGRGLTEEALKAYRVGFAPTGWDRLVVASEKAGVDAKLLIDAGLAMPKRDGRGANDRFHGRITFPLCDARGNVRGFGARAMSPDQQPKYLNTSENELFHKGRQLFGLHLARAAAAKTGVVVLVEGYTDVIALRQSGVEHVVALMGTAMTPEQVSELARLAPKLVLALDPDGAGEAAMEKAYGLARGSRLDLKVAELPEGRDPAELVQDGRGEELRAALEAPKHFAEFQIERIIGATELGSGESRDAALARVAPVISAMTPGSQREELAAKTAEILKTSPALFHQLVTTAKQAGTPVYGGSQRQSRDPDQPPEQGRARQAPRRLDPYDDQERAMLAVMIGLGTTGREALARLEPSDLQVPHVRAVMQWFQAGGDTGGQLPADDVLSEVARDILLRAHDLNPRPALLELELAQLDLRRLEAQIADARRRGQPVDQLHRQGGEVRARLDAAMAHALDA